MLSAWARISICWSWLPSAQPARGEGAAVLEIHPEGRAFWPLLNRCGETNDAGFYIEPVPAKAERFTLSPQDSFALHSCAPWPASA